MIPPSHLCRTGSCDVGLKFLLRERSCPCLNDGFCTTMALPWTLRICSFVVGSWDFPRFLLSHFRF